MAHHFRHTPLTRTPAVPANNNSSNSTHKEDWEIIRHLLPNIWPKDDRATKIRVVTALVLLAGGKILNVQVPFMFKHIIDSLSIPLDPITAQGAWTVVGTVIAGCKWTCKNIRSGLLRTEECDFHKCSPVGNQTSSSQRIYPSTQCGCRFPLTQSDWWPHKSHRSRHQVCKTIIGSQTNVSPQRGFLHAFVDRLPCCTNSLRNQHCLRCPRESPLTYNFGADYAGIALATMLAYSWFTIRTTAWRLQFRKRANEADNRAASVLIDTLSNYETVKHFNNERHEIEQYDRALEGYEKATIGIYKSLAYLNIGQSVIFSLSLTAMMYMAAQGVVNGLMTVGDLVMINQLVFQLSLPLNFLGSTKSASNHCSSVYRDLRQSLIDMQTLFNLQKTGLIIKDKPDAKPLQITKGGEIRFENVSFRYSSSGEIFKDISLVIPAGKKVALVGPSGCGKSTLFKLCFRFYDIDSGRILIDSQDIRDVTLDSLRSHIGIVPQDSSLFNSDVMHNIRYGRLDASNEEVQKVARLAKLDRSIEKWPSGWSSLRLAIARSMLKDPSILFFDEATSALDVYTEQELMRNIGENLLNKRRTSVFIAHRLKTIADADLIIVLNDGKVVEQGSHEGLMNIDDGVYRGMWLSQSVTSTDNSKGKHTTAS
ncbi:mitochondrial ABC transporter ATM [Puccinia sorghi]|uniref:Iron-sulfur clusters transporter ATM1, mitochondrial n=1 Tax=Puccinia sorghi TaxID=27349 RepID=A0A0L6VEP6_9BASI|nr:mitochondrial ABC transporter ATM [Puccinia sorghi]